MSLFVVTGFVNPFAAASIDVERAICATRRGEPLGPQSRH